MSVLTKKANAAQRAWLIRYEKNTCGFEPMLQDRFDRSEISFEDMAHQNVKWFQGWAIEVSQTLEREIPVTEDGKEPKK